VPSVCSSCISRLRWVLLGVSSSCTSGRLREALLYHSVFSRRSRMAQARFSHDIDTLKTIAADALAHAATKGASACEAETLGRLRPDGDGAQGRGRDDRIQPRQEPGRHRLCRQAQRLRKHRRFRRARDPRHRRSGADDRAVYRGGRSRGARGSGGPCARSRRPRPFPSLESAGRRSDRDREGLRGPLLSGSTSAW